MEIQSRMLLPAEYPVSLAAELENAISSLGKAFPPTPFLIFQWIWRISPLPEEIVMETWDSQSVPMEILMGMV